MPPPLIIARLTLREAARRRLLLAVAILTVIVIAASGWGFSRLSTLRSGGQPVSHVEIMTATATFVMLLAYMFSFVLAIGAAFLAAPAIATDVESGLALAMLPRPIRRGDVVMGKWLGLAVLLAVYTAITGAVELAVVKLVTGYAPPHPAMALVFLVWQAVVLLTLALWASTRLPAITGGIIALVLFGIAWIAGIAAAFGAAFNNAGITTAGTIVGLILPTDGLWRGALYNLEPVAVIAVSGATARTNPIGVTAPPSTPYALWAVAWIIVVLFLATRSFSRRDL